MGSEVFLTYSWISSLRYTFLSVRVQHPYCFTFETSIWFIFSSSRGPLTSSSLQECNGLCTYIRFTKGATIILTRRLPVSHTCSRPCLTHEVFTQDFPSFPFSYLPPFLFLLSSFPFDLFFSFFLPSFFYFYFNVTKIDGTTTLYTEWSESYLTIGNVLRPIVILSQVLTLSEKRK